MGVELPLLGEIGDSIDDIILDYLGVPPDTSLCYLGEGTIVRQYDKNNEECQKFTGCFCRDWLSDVLYDYENNEISLEEAIEKLAKWNIDEE